MKKDYIKLPVEMLYDPRFGTLTDDLWRLVMQLYMLAGETDQDGLLPHARDMAWELRLGLGTLQISLHQLCERGLVHQTPLGWVVTGFKESQAAPNSTERSRAFRKRRKSATQDENESSDDPAQDPAQDPIRSPTRNRTYGASEMQPARHLPVSSPVAGPDPDPGQPGQFGKSRHRHKAKGQPVDTYPADTCPVDNFVEKGRKISDSNASSTSSTRDLIKYLKPSLKIKPPLLVLLDRPDLEKKPENFRPSQGKTLENRLDAPGSAPLAGARQGPPGRIGHGAEQSGDTPGAMQAPVDKTVENSVDNSVEKGRKISDPDDIPP